jgi:flagellar basal body-associated protein FliL
MNSTPTMNADPAFISQLPDDMPPKKDNKKKIIIIVVIALLLLLCCCLVIVGFIGYKVYQGGGDYSWELTLGNQLLNSYA